MDIRKSIQKTMILVLRQPRPSLTDSSIIFNYSLLLLLVLPINMYRRIARLPFTIRARKTGINLLQSMQHCSTPGPVQRGIELKLQEGLSPTHLQVFNESNQHNVPRGSETHFRVMVVSQQFQDVPLIQRHRMVQGLLKDELDSSVHALSIQAKTPEQWEKCSEIHKSPPCLGGSKAT